MKDDFSSCRVDCFYPDWLYIFSLKKYFGNFLNFYQSFLGRFYVYILSCFADNFNACTNKSLRFPYSLKCSSLK